MAAIIPLLFFLIFFFGTLFDQGYSNPIVAGTDVGVFQSPDKSKPVGQHLFPYMAHIIIRTILIDKDNKPVPAHSFGGGVIISAKAILTAAHGIVQPISRPWFYIRTGIVHVEEQTIGVWTNKYVINNEYVEGPDRNPKNAWFDNDIAILFLEDKDTLSFTKPFVKQAILPNKHDTLNPNVRGAILGWGDTNEVDKNIPKMLQKAEMVVISYEECRYHKPEWNFEENSMICLLDLYERSSSCHGDSGGPFVANGIVYGIASFGEHDRFFCNPEKPSVYVSLIKHREWIDRELAARAKSAAPSTSASSS